MTSLEQLARAVIDADLLQRGAALDALAKELARIQTDRTECAGIILEAKGLYDDGETIAVDDDPLVSVGEKGIWVEAWVYVGVDDDGVPV